MRDIGREAAWRPMAGMAVLLAATQIALADDLGSPAPTSREPRFASAQWSVSVTPYGWFPFLNGDVTVRGRTVSLDVNPIQVLEHLERAPWMSYVEARRGPLAFYNDIFYANLTASASRSRFLRAPTLDATLGVDFEEAVIEFGGAYEIAKWTSGAPGGLKDAYVPVRYTALDILAGARYWRQDMAINLALTGTLDTTGLVISSNRAIARAGAVDWVDPLVGFRVRHQLAPGQELTFRADVGGFDVGSRISWNLLAAYSWILCVNNGVTYSGMLGYRALSVDYAKGSGIDRYEYDVLQHGPVMGMTAKF